MSPTEQPVKNPNESADSESLSSMMSDLDEVTNAGAASTAARDAQLQHELVESKLGLASSLFLALRSKHPATAVHSLRVALGCSSWALHLELDDRQRDALEIAALLHDVGKIGVPDHVLAKPGSLDAEEYMLIERGWHYGSDIIQACCASEDVVNCVKYARAWYDGSKYEFDIAGKELPFNARVLAIMDAFDSMTTDSVYRRAYSRDRAMAELFEHAGTQFDPDLVKHFYHLVASDQITFCSSVARRWLQQLEPDTANEWWTLQQRNIEQKQEGAGLTDNSTNSSFHTQLFEAMHDGVVFVDNNLSIILWNRAAERLSGISAESVIGRQWDPSLVGMHDEKMQEMPATDCPVAYSIWAGSQTLRRLSIQGRQEQLLSIDVHVSPVFARNGEPLGATLIMHDASSQISLEERVESLNRRATMDPLTQVNNRAEFDQAQVEYIEHHSKQGLPCSLIICDIDHFKKVNDTYGHQAGDEVLISFASILKRFCRSGDLVARYGGEEFVMLCADCDNASATTLAERIRKELAQTTQPALGNTAVTCSMGVTELQSGDTAETMLRRADRALYQAKDGGRNMVVQLGSGIEEKQDKKSTRASWFKWFQGSSSELSVERKLIASVPMNIAAEKLRGFVADHQAEIESIKENHIALKISGENSPMNRRSSDRPVPFFVEITFEEINIALEGRRSASASRTLCHVTVKPRKVRDRRRNDIMERAIAIVSSLKSYLIASDYEEDDA